MVRLVTFKELYDLNPLKARQKLIEIHERTHRRVRETARLLGCSPGTVCKWVKRGSLESLSHAPRRPRRTVPPEALDHLKSLRQTTNFGRRRLKRLLKSRHGVVMPERTISYWLAKWKLSKPQKKRARFKGVRYYVWEDLKPLQDWQVDVKDVRDSKTLPPEVYRHLLRERLPRYQWTALEVKCRVKFLAYSHRVDRSNGMAFFRVLTGWLRAFGVSHTLRYQTDWGNEFGGPSPRMWLELQRNVFDPMNCELLKIRKRNWKDNAYVERTHRTDDEEFYVPKLLEIPSYEEHFPMAWGYVWHFNTQRPHDGHHMEGQTPAQRLRAFCPSVPDAFFAFPPILLDAVSSSKLFIKAPSVHEPIANY